MTARAGDGILVESKKVTQPGRRGVIEEVLQEEPPRFRVRWDDGRTSIFTPAAGSARIEAQKKTRAKAPAKAKTGAKAKTSPKAKAK
jgi:hypothetical protein